ncbi:hypothetical protein C8R44DRAFT_858418 [Mycena epipterygia]|nr:hypothetical protein C8R44DRAFT_858418 [Mycena epipterygia]
MQIWDVRKVRSYGVIRVFRWLKSLLVMFGRVKVEVMVVFSGTVAALVTMVVVQSKGNVDWGTTKIEPEPGRRVSTSRPSGSATPGTKPTAASPITKDLVTIYHGFEPSPSPPLSTSRLITFVPDVQIDWRDCCGGQGVTEDDISGPAMYWTTHNFEFKFWRLNCQTVRHVSTVSVLVLWLPRKPLRLPHYDRHVIYSYHVYFDASTRHSNP